MNGTAAEFENMNWSSSRLFNGKGESIPGDSLGDFGTPDTKQSIVANSTIMTSRDTVVTSRDSVVTSRDSVVTSRDIKISSPLKKAELFPIPRTNLFVFNGKVETLQNVIDKLHSSSDSTVISSNHSKPDVRTSRDSINITRDIMTEKTLEAVAEKLETVPNNNITETFPIQVYEDSSEIPIRRSNGVVMSVEVTSRDYAMTSRDNLNILRKNLNLTRKSAMKPSENLNVSREIEMTPREIEMTSREIEMTSCDNLNTSRDKQDEQDSLTRFLDDLQIIPTDQEALQRTDSRSIAEGVRRSQSPGGAPPVAPKRNTSNGIVLTRHSSPSPDPIRRPPPPTRVFSPQASKKKIGFKPGGYSLAAGVKGARNISEAPLMHVSNIDHHERVSSYDSVESNTSNASLGGRSSDLSTPRSSSPSQFAGPISTKPITHTYNNKAPPKHSLHIDSSSRDVPSYNSKEVANMLRQSYTARTESTLDDNTLDFIKEFKDSKVIPINRLRDNEVINRLRDNENSTEVDSKIPENKNITIATPAPTTISTTPRDVITPSRDVRAARAEEPRAAKQDNMAKEPEVMRYCKAKYTFKAEGARELGFKKKDIIRIRREVDANWIEGELNEQVGIFPRNYVDILDPEPTQSPQDVETTFESKKSPPSPHSPPSPITDFTPSSMSYVPSYQRDIGSLPQLSRYQKNDESNKENRREMERKKEEKRKEEERKEQERKAEDRRQSSARRLAEEKQRVMEQRAADLRRKEEEKTLEEETNRREEQDRSKKEKLDAEKQRVREQRAAEQLIKEEERRIAEERRRRQEEDDDRRREEVEQQRIYEEQKRLEQEKIRKEEEKRLRREANERKRREEEERRKEELERKRKEGEEEMRRVQDRIRREEEARVRLEEDERKKAEEEERLWEEERLRKEEEDRKRRENEQRKRDEERRQRENDERKRQEERLRRLEEERIREEEVAREEEERLREEKRKREEERLQELERLHQQEMEEGRRLKEEAEERARVKEQNNINYRVSNSELGNDEDDDTFEVKAIYSFKSTEDGELTFKKGATITVTEVIDDNWYYGQLGAAQGIFPTSYAVKIEAPDLPPPPDLTAQRIEDCLEEYESPETVDQSRDSFLDDSGNLDNTDNLENSGIVDNRSAEDSDDFQDYELYVAQYSYQPLNDDELELQRGDIVEVIERCDDGWFVGTSQRTEKFGTFPGNYVLPSEE
ncbi:histone-lysine N-methyltransferase, H3 lysine-79 specific-like isoform X4 [Bolinopsis microptera]|uniref:histone-lysine N-methyltransferase, H3 lysine-79 specific-like isoform X4 n=1 Tax=Bolinopsis microptera TaxID=2820187 RepID=UPI00307A6532